MAAAGWMRVGGAPLPDDGPLTTGTGLGSVRDGKTCGSWMAGEGCSLSTPCNERSKNEVEMLVHLEIFHGSATHCALSHTSRMDPLLPN